MTIEIGHIVRIQSNATSDPSAVPTNRWQRKFPGQPSFSDITGTIGEASTYQVKADELGCEIRLKQTLNGGFAYSNILEVTSEVPGGVITLTSGRLKLRGIMYGKGQITGPNGFNQDIGSSFNLELTTPGDYSLPMLRVWEISFKDSEDAVFDFDPEFFVGNISSYYRTFERCRKFNGDVSNWDVSNVTQMYQMFSGASSFNGDISNWKVSKVKTMDGMFHEAGSFNADISGWNTSNVTNMNEMFFRTDSFNADISGWNTSKVTNMGAMFTRNSVFNQNIGIWDTSNVTNMDRLFDECSSFNQNLSGWCVTNITSKPEFFDFDSGFQGQTSRQPQWGTCP